MKKKVVSGKNLPARLPLTTTVTALLAMDHWEVSGVWRGVIGAVLAFVWVASLVEMFTETAVELFKGEG